MRQIDKIASGYWTTRSETLTQNPVAGRESGLSSWRSPPGARRGAGNGQKIAPPSQPRSAGARLKEAASATARLKAIVGPVYLILAKLEKNSIPSPMITVPALAT